MHLLLNTLHLWAAKIAVFTRSFEGFGENVYVSDKNFDVFLITCTERRT
ncbi:MAG: hypothetical protein ABL949_06565 [Fimbriimonadaceae bacterium]